MIRTLIWAVMSSLLYLLSYSLIISGQRICTSIYWAWANYVTITLIRCNNIYIYSTQYEICTHIFRLQNGCITIMQTRLLKNNFSRYALFLVKNKISTLYLKTLKSFQPKPIYKRKFIYWWIISINNKSILLFFVMLYYVSLRVS